MDIALLIPTLNRPDFLLRALHYYDSVNYRGYILIGDSSKATIADNFIKDLHEFNNRLKICYYPLPGYNGGQAIKFLAGKATTKYVAFVADDDFLVPSGIGRCIEFLDDNPDYVAAQGVFIAVGMHSIDSQSIQYTNYCPQPIISGTTAAQRLVSHLTNYSPNGFSVHRIEAWRAMFKDGEDIADTSFGSELLHSCLSVILGKTKQLEGLYSIRQGHENRYWLPSWFDWITNKSWYPGYIAFRQYLADAIVNQDKTTMEEAKAIVSHAFSIYLGKWISRSINSPNSDRNWRSIARQIPGARTIAHVMQSVLNKAFNDDEYYWTNMIKPKSPYYKDFMPIYRVLTRNRPT